MSKRSHTTALVVIGFAALLIVLFVGKAIVNSLYSKYDSIILPLSAQYGVPVSWIKAFIGTESSFVEDPAVRPGDTSYGLMQVTPGLARDYGYPDDHDTLVDPQTNISIGVQYMASLRAKFGEDIRTVYAGYNAGAKAAVSALASNAQVQANVNRMLNWLAKFA